MASDIDTYLDLSAKYVRLLAENENLKKMYQSCDLHRGRLLAENERLRRALEAIATSKINDNRDSTWSEWGKGLRDIARVALEGK